VPQREPDVGQRIDRQVLAPEHTDHPGRVGERRDFSKQRRLDVLARNQKLDGVDACSLSRGDQILTFCDEEPEFVPPAAVVQLANELELLVLAGGDQAD
jgi:hypothetical protein